jgi:hypothetical protein
VPTYGISPDNISGGAVVGVEGANEEQHKADRRCYPDGAPTDRADGETDRAGGFKRPNGKSQP